MSETAAFFVVMFGLAALVSLCVFAMFAIQDWLYDRKKAKR